MSKLQTDEMNKYIDVQQIKNKQKELIASYFFCLNCIYQLVSSLIIESGDGGEFLEVGGRGSEPSPASDHGLGQKW